MHSTVRVTAISLILLSALARLIAIGRDPSQLERDVDHYVALADSLVRTGVFGNEGTPTAFRPPLYPLVLGAMYWPIDRSVESPGMRAWCRRSVTASLHVALGAATALLAWHIARRWELGRWSVAAGLLVAIDPILVHYASLPMTETLAAFLCAVSLALTTWNETPTASRSVAAGFALGLAVLCRTTFAVMAVAVSAAIWFFSRAGTRDRRIAAATVLATMLLVQTPWLVRNWLVLGRPIVTTTHGGYTLLLGNNHVFYDEVLGGPRGVTWSNDSLSQWQADVHRQAAEARADSEPAYDRFCYQLAKRTIFNRPADFFRAIGYRIASFWRVMPVESGAYAGWMRLASGLVYVPELALALIALASARAWRWPVVLLPMTLASFTLVHAIYWSDMRMRGPVMPAVAILAAAGAAQIGRNLFPRLAGRSADRTAQPLRPGRTEEISDGK